MEDDFSADVNTTGALVPDGSVTTGMLEVTGDDDWFELTITESQTLILNLIGDTLSDPFLRLYDADGGLLAFNDDNFPSRDSQITFNFEAGTYFVSARAFNDSGVGSYELTAEAPAEPVFQWNSEAVVNTSTSDFQGDSHVAVLNDGRYVIVWRDRVDTDDTIHGQIFNTDGTRSGTEFTVDAPPAGLDQENPDVVATPDGGFAISYNQQVSVSRVGVDVHLTRYDANGAQTFQGIVSDDVSPDTYPELTIVGNEIWIGSSQDSGIREDNAIVDRYNLDTDGSVSFVSDFRANLFTTGEQEDVDFAVLNNGNVAIVWSQESAVEMRIFNSDGTAVTSSDIQVENNSNSFGRTGPEATALSNGGYVVTWSTFGVTDNNGVRGNDVRGHIYDENGSSISSEFVINTTTSGSRVFVVTTPTNDGGFAAFWFDTEGGDTIEGQLFDALGNPVREQFTAASSFDPARFPSADTLPDGRIILTWGDDEIDGNSGGIGSVILDPRDGDIQGSEAGETLLGSDLNDQVEGLGGADVLMGMNGDDTLIGGQGNDVIDGGVGQDTSSYATASSGVTVSLLTGSGTVGDAQGDVLMNIENLSGSTFADALSGDDAVNTLSGQAGNDTLLGDAVHSLSLNSLEGQLYRAFEAVFDRAPDAGGFNAFLTEMRLGNLTQENAITDLVNSDEFQNTYGTLGNEDFIRQLFLNVLDREGDSGSIAAFTTALNEGGTRASVVMEFANSAEFVQLMTLPSAAFATNVIIHPAEAQVFRIYQAVFLRDPDEAGFTAFTNSIQAGVLTVEEITAEFVASEEFQLTYGDLDNADFVELLFTNVLPGNMDAQGRTDFTTALETGTLTRETMVAEFVETFEFVQRMVGPAETFVSNSFSGSGDTLDGGAGDDVLFGGRGADEFVFDTEAGGADTILDFTSGTDSLDLGTNADFDTFAEIMTAGTQAGLDTVFDFGGGNTLTLANVVLSELTEGDFGLGAGSSKPSEAVTTVVTPLPQAEAVSDIADFELYDMFG